MKYDFKHIHIAHLKRPSFGKNPQADWRVIFIGSIILAVLAMFFGLHLFVRINGGTIFTKENTEEAAIEVPRLATLKNIILKFETKRTEFEAIKSGREAIDDPAI